MDENISVKYAVYIDKDGDDILEVVRDSEPEAKVDMERLKKETSYVRIEKASIKNFGKDDEKVVDSETVTSWDSADGASKDNDDELSDHYKASGNNSGSDGSGQVVQVGTVAPPVVPPVITPVATTPVVEEKKEPTWQEHYAKYGALVYAEGWGELTEAKKSVAEIKPDATASTTTPDSTASTTTTPVTPTASESASGITTPSINNGSTPPIESQQHKDEPKIISLSDEDIDKIASALKEKLGQNSVQNNVAKTSDDGSKKEPEKTIG